MKHFIYTYTESKPPKDGSGTKKTISLYQIKGGRPHHLINMTETFVSQNQLVLMALEKSKALPKKTFELTPSRTYKHNIFSLEQEGIATIDQV